MHSFYIEKELPLKQLVSAFEKTNLFSGMSIAAVKEVTCDSPDVNILLVSENVGGQFKTYVCMCFKNNSNVASIDIVLERLASDLDCSCACCVGMQNPFIWQEIKRDGSSRVVLIDDNALENDEIEIMRELAENEPID